MISVVEKIFDLNFDISIAEFSGVTVWNLWYQTSGLDYCLNDDVVDDDFCEKDFYIF